MYILSTYVSIYSWTATYTNAHSLTSTNTFLHVHQHYRTSKYKSKNILCWVNKRIGWTDGYYVFCSFYSVACLLALPLLLTLSSFSIWTKLNRIFNVRRTLFLLQVVFEILDDEKILHTKSCKQWRLYKRWRGTHTDTRMCMKNACQMKPYSCTIACIFYF